VTLAGLTLVLTAAFFHAAWNLFAKRTDGGVPFVWLCATVASVLWAPVALAVLLIAPPAIGATALPFLAGSAVLHTGYYVSLQMGYRWGDLSLVYPLARGSGALLAIGGAVVLFGERPTLLSLTGALLIIGGTVAVAGTGRGSSRDLGRGIALALTTGGLICAYTLWDAYQVTELAIPALLLVWTSDLGGCLLLAPAVRGRGPEVREIWRSYRREVVGVAVLSPVAYVLVLVALRFAPVSYVAPAREISILIGVMMGHRLLGEANVGRRLAATAAVVGGMICVSAG
jgi:drug/metabolite transporter (DMT)-like permease